MKMMKNAVEEKAYENQEAYQRTQMQKDMILERYANRAAGSPDSAS